MTTINTAIQEMINGGNSTDDIRAVLNNIDATQSRIAELTAQRTAIEIELAGLVDTTAIQTARETVASITGAIDLEQIELARLVAISSGRARGMTIGIEIEFKVRSADYNTTARATFRDCFNTSFGSAIIGSDVRGYPNNHNRYSSKWKLTGDGSLDRTGDLEPMELISPILKGESGLMQAVDIMNTLENCGGEVDRQCSVHVHFGIERMAWASVKRIVETYTYNQDLINTTLPPSRRNHRDWAKNMPIQTQDAESGVCLERIQNYDDSMTTDEVVRQMGGSMAVYPAYRYFSCNLIGAYEKHKTIEFRAHGGTTDGLKLEYWIRFLHLIVKSAETNRNTNRAYSTLSEMTASLSDKTDLNLTHAQNDTLSDWGQMVTATRTNTDTATGQSPYRSRAKAQLAGKAIADFLEQRVIAVNQA